MPRSSNSRKRDAAEQAADVAADLSYQEAHTALELSLAQLQNPDLPVETMGELYQRARSYAQRCEAVLNQVEQSIALWDPSDPDGAPQAYEP